MMRNIILFGMVVSFLRMDSYAEDKKYHLDDADAQRPNYNDPSKPNYMKGSRTDMAPKVEVDIDVRDPKLIPENKEEKRDTKSVNEYKPSNKTRKEAEQEQWQFQWGKQSEEEYKNKKAMERWESLNQ